GQEPSGDLQRAGHAAGYREITSAAGLPPPAAGTGRRRMTPRHHLDPSTIIGHAAGALSPELSAIVATHLEGCPHCRQAMAQADRVGGLLLDQQQAANGGMARHDRLRDAMLQRLEQAGAPGRPPEPAPPSNDPDRLPTP